MEPLRAALLAPLRREGPCLEESLGGDPEFLVSRFASTKPAHFEHHDLNPFRAASLSRFLYPAVAHELHAKDLLALKQLLPGVNSE